MEIHFKIIGIILIVLAFIHAIFPRYFNWKEEFCNVSLINRQMMYIHTFFIAITVFLIGLLCVTSATELAGTVLGKRVCLGIGFFCAVRLFVQFIGYSSALWKGKRFETIIHIVFSFLWVYLSVVFLAAYFN